MKRIALWQIWILIVSSPLFSTPLQDRPRLVHADSLVYRQYTDQVVQDLWGNVEFVQDSASLTCQHARWWRTDNRLRLEKNVTIDDGKRILKGQLVIYEGENRIEKALGQVTLFSNDQILHSHKLTYWQEDQIAEATDSVSVESEKDSIRIECGFLRYDRKQDYGLLLKDPVLIKFDTTETENIVIHGDTMQIWGDSLHVMINGEVQIQKGDITATCKQAEYWSGKDQLILTQLPIVYYDEQQMQGDSVCVELDGTRFKGVELIGKSEIRSTDSTSTNVDRLQGRQILMSDLEDSVRTITIEGQAISEYNVTEEATDSESETGFNKVTGDRIILTFINKKIKRVRVESDPGLCTGEFKPDEK